MMRRLKIFSTTIFVLLIFLNTIASASQEIEAKIHFKPPEVFVISTLYKRHETTPAYGLAELRDLILKIGPDVFVLDVTPKEIREQKVWVGKVEYPQIIFPLINARKAKAYASEPDEPLFTQLSAPVGEAYKNLERESPKSKAALTEHERATYALLQQLWRQVGDVNSEMTDQLVGAKRDAENRLVGIVAETNQRKWNEHHAEKLLAAAKENPGKRIVMLVGIESRYEVLRLVKSNKSIQLVDVENWLKQK
jgi:hypothetical protein